MLVYIALSNVTVFVDLDKVNGAFPKNSSSLLLIWADGHPNDSLDCVAIYNRKLTTVSCSDVYSSICEMYVVHFLLPSIPTFPTKFKYT